MSANEEFYRQKYLLLIEEVRQIDKEAALYLEKEAREITGFNEDGNLSRCFCWEDSKQGHVYWYTIHKKLLLEYYGIPKELISTLYNPF
jgi:hypothetical protein